jgi:hypothetical protein
MIFWYTTPSGRNWFYDMWVAAKKKKARKRNASEFDRAKLRE